MNLSRFFILHSILIGLLIAGWFLGYLPVLLEADHFFAIPIVGVLTCLGLGLVATGRSEGALWLANELPVVGLILTVTGLLWSANGDIGSDQFKRDIIFALVGNLMGVAGMLWIRFNERVCR